MNFENLLTVLRWIDFSLNNNNNNNNNNFLQHTIVPTV